MTCSVSTSSLERAGATPGPRTISGTHRTPSVIEKPWS